MKQNKGRGSKTVNTDALRPKAFEEGLEPLARELYDLACRGSKDIWPEIPDVNALRDDPKLRSRLFEAAHRGMMAAQDLVLDRIASDAGLSGSEEVLARNICDSMVWQVLQGQLCYARRLYKGHPQPNPKQSNLESVVKAAKWHVKENPGSVALISDLTSLVQVGDLLTFGPDGTVGIAEVKEGEKNRKIHEFLRFFLESPCERALHYFAKSEGKKSVDQLGRMLRQVGRMQHVTESFKVGDSVDPDTNHRIRIPDEYVEMHDWYPELNDAIEKCEGPGWAIHVIDKCLYVGCYSGDSMRLAGHLIFNGWFESQGADGECPRKLLLDGMSHPLALPVFNLSIPEQAKFDILFGRKQVCMGINIDAFREECSAQGLKVRSGSNRETAQLAQKGFQPFKHRGKAVFISNGKTEIVLMDGIFLRAMFHCQRPIALIKGMLDHSDTESAEQSESEPGITTPPPGGEQG